MDSYVQYSPLGALILLLVLAVWCYRYWNELRG